MPNTAISFCLSILSMALTLVLVYNQIEVAVNEWDIPSASYDTVEGAAKAYDEAACILRVANTRTNFWPCSLTSNPTPALPSKITSLLFHRLRGRNNTSDSLPDSSLIKKQEIQGEEKKHNEGSGDFNTTENASDYLTTSLESCFTKEDSSGRNLGLDYCNFRMLLNLPGVMTLLNKDLIWKHLIFILWMTLDHPVTTLHSRWLKRFEEPKEAENFLNEPSMLRAAMKRIKYERKFSASLYAFNGIPECLKLRLEFENVEGGRVKVELSIQSLEGKKGEGNGNEVMAKKVEESLDSPSSSVETKSSSSNECEFCLWSSLDLPTICSVN
ncbi:hypothetical protein SLEP1_g10433 [Rubroshorea leprosula]|uniref:Uncharacterized protein n=1 Tax=Rubroshorea leprosula TaxID=152421 RepID=A0AAV5IG07_9ROSI|nr:hypothetical protein SLEP1_g10433 [Rubroshorea leprosula]